MRGRPQKVAAIGKVRELTLEEVKGAKRGNVPALQSFRDSHHKMARLFAQGLRTSEVAELCGYSLTRVSVLYGSPTFKELIAEKRKVEDAVARDAMVQYNEMILQNGMKAERKLADKLDKDDDEEELSVRELLSISRDAADRVGLSKRSVQTNISVDFASMLDRAIARSKETAITVRDVKLIETGFKRRL